MKLKHYKSIAEAIKMSESQLTKSIAGSPMLYKYVVVNSLCSILKAENPKFDEAKFRELLK